MALQSYQEARDKVVEGTPLSILMGNGFSQGWSYQIFNYENLYNNAVFGTSDQKLRQIFDNLDTYDFESVMRALESAESVCTIYDVDQSKIDEISEDKEALKAALISVISNTHPERSSNVETNQYEKAKPFIMGFNNIFTVNYDLLVYWIINKKDIVPEGYHHFNDGFSSTNWVGWPDQCIYFLHGGLHLYDTGLEVRKHTFNYHIDESIIDKVRENLNRGKFPLFVSEPTSDKKLEKIRKSSYLSDCYSALGELEGVLFIHGHSMAENDQHIFKKINSSSVSKVFISIFGDENSDSNLQTKANAKRFINRKNIEFYQAESAQIWN